MRLISEGRLFLGRLWFDFLAALFCTCFAFKEVLYSSTNHIVVHFYSSIFFESLQCYPNSSLLMTCSNQLSYLGTCNISSKIRFNNYFCISLLQQSLECFHKRINTAVVVLHSLLLCQFKCNSPAKNVVSLLWSVFVHLFRAPTEHFLIVKPSFFSIYVEWSKSYLLTLMSDQ